MKHSSSCLIYYLPRPLENSAKQVPKEGFSPHWVSFGGFPSTSLMWPENTLKENRKTKVNLQSLHCGVASRWLLSQFCCVANCTRNCTMCCDIKSLTLSHPEALHWRVKSSGVRQSKTTKETVLAGLGEERLRWSKTQLTVDIETGKTLHWHKFDVVYGVVVCSWLHEAAMRKCSDTGSKFFW